MKITVTKNQFVQAFKNMGREENFTLDGLDALFNYLEEMEKETGEEMELDVIALCCDFTQYENFEEFKKDYCDYEDLDELERDQLVLKVGDKSFIIQNF